MSENYCKTVREKYLPLLAFDHSDCVCILRDPKKNEDISFSLTKEAFDDGKIPSRKILERAFNHLLVRIDRGEIDPSSLSV